MNNDIRNEKIETINELIAVTRDSADFYGDASDKARNPQLKRLFGRMAESKKGLVTAMSREVRAEGAEPEADGTFRGSMHKLYGEMRGKLGGDDYGYVAELEESEDRMLHAFTDVLKDDDVPLPVKQAVQSYLPTVREHHDTMRSRKWAMDAARH